MPYTDVVKCDGCGTDVTIVLNPGQTFHNYPRPVYCPACSTLNAAKQQAFRMVMCSGCGVAVKHYQVSPSGLCPQCQLTQINQATQAQVRAQQATQGAYKNVAYKRTGRSSVPYGSTSPYVTGQQQAPTQTSSQCSFTWDVPRSAYAVTAGYQPNFIEFIKAKVPVSDRVPEYDSITRKFKCWYIKEAWFDVLHELASQLWPGAVYVLSKQQAEDAWRAQEKARADALAAQRQAVLGPFESALLDFCSLCDIDALRRARNAMAITLHPDKQGGDADKMAKLNASWYIVETELKKRSESK